MYHIGNVQEMGMLEVVDGNDNVIGLETRAKIHREGLLHREIHIWFITPRAEIIFQHRAKDKDTYPDKLDATVAGHVEPGISYEETAVKECKEETGIDIGPNNLVFIAKVRNESFDEVTGLANNAIRSQYVYFYKDSLDNLQIEDGKALGFEEWSIDDLSRLSALDKKKFIPLILHREMLDVFNRAREILLK